MPGAQLGYFEKKRGVVKIRFILFGYWKLLHNDNPRTSLHILFNYYSRSCQGYSFLDNNFCCEGWCDLNLAETTWKAPLRCIIFPTQTQKGGGCSRINHDLDEGLGN